MCAKLQCVPNNLVAGADQVQTEDKFFGLDRLLLVVTMQNSQDKSKRHKNKKDSCGWI